MDENLIIPDVLPHIAKKAVALSLILYSRRYCCDNVKAIWRTLHPDLKETEEWVMAQQLRFLKKQAAESPLADQTPPCPFRHLFMGGTHHPQMFEDYKNACLQSSLKVDEVPVEDIEVTSEIPPVDDGPVTIRCRWEDLLEHLTSRCKSGIR